LAPSRDIVSGWFESRTERVLCAAVVWLCLVASSASAEPWYRGRYGKNRIVHLSITAVGGVVYPATGWLQDRLAPTTCKWCSPTDPDASIRATFRWDDRGTAGMLSNVTAYAMSPAVGVGLILLNTPPTWADVIDNIVPIGEAMVVTEWVTRGVKLAVGRERPYAHYGASESAEDNLSVPSGHTSRAYALATSAGVIAHMRGYSIEPIVWAVGMTLAGTSGYLRIAADSHYLTDVLAGAALGAAAGLTVPWLMRRDVEVVVTGQGIALAGTW
jgi:membrane-associated phospholipid phosphatase